MWRNVLSLRYAGSRNQGLSLLLDTLLVVADVVRPELLFVIPERGRLAAAAARDAEVTIGRWRRVRAFLRPDGQPQERHLSVLAPLLRLGVEWPARLVEAIDPTDPGMHLLFWGEGGLW